MRTVLRCMWVAGLAGAAIVAMIIPIADAANGNATFDWTMPARTGLDEDNDGVIDARTTRSEVNPGKFTVRFNACASTGAVDTYRWTIDTSLSQTTGSCAGFVPSLREGAHVVTLDLVAADQSVIATTTKNVVVQDWLIVAVGDSLGSGEGNPDIPGNFDPDNFRTPSWQNERCHRSSISGQARAARAIENNDPRTSVTLVHLSCSGARIPDGLLGPYSGIAPPSGAADLPAQLDRVQELISDREIDALVMSIGVNDARFGDIVFGCIVTEPCMGPDTQVVGVGAFQFLTCNFPFVPTTPCNLFFAGLSPTPTAAQNFSSGMETLPILFGQLFQGVNTRFPLLDEDSSRVYVTEYPNTAEYNNGELCGGNPFTTLPGVSSAEWGWVRDTVTPRLNYVVNSAADFVGWTKVPGIFAAFSGRGYCADAGWIRRVEQSFQMQFNRDGTAHPNGQGHAVYGARIHDTLFADLYPSGDVTSPRPPLDSVPPVVVGMPDRDANANGWYRAPVTIDWRATDASGTASDPPSTNAATEGDSVLYTSEASCDAAGNCSTGSLRLSIDTTPPTITCTGPTAFTLGGGGTVGATVADALSGPAQTSLASPAATSTVGAKTASFTAADRAGNTTTAACAYIVSFSFTGFSQPVDNGGVVNVVKAGRAVPLKWRLTNAAGNPFTTLTAATVSVLGLTCLTGSTDDLVEETTAGASGLQNLGDGYYQVNWKSPTSYAGSCKTLRLDLGDGVLRTALFRFTK